MNFVLLIKSLACPQRIYYFVLEGETTMNMML